MVYISCKPFPIGIFVVEGTFFAAFKFKLNIRRFGNNLFTKRWLSVVLMKNS